MLRYSRVLIENLRTEMGIKKMRQADLARAASITKAQLSNYLSGKKFPEIATIQKLADALGVSADDLMRDRHASPTKDPATRHSIVEVKREYRAKKDFEWMDRRFRKGENVDLEEDIALLLRGGLIEVRLMSVSFPPLKNVETAQALTARQSELLSIISTLSDSMADRLLNVARIMADESEDSGSSSVS